MKKIRTPSPAMMVASVALFVALGGSAYAVGKNSVGTKQLKNGAVSTPKLKNGAVTTAKINVNSRVALRGALAYGQISSAGPALIAARTKSVTAVSRPQSGVYCLTLEPAVEALVFDTDGDPTRPVVASVEWGNTASPTEIPIVMPRGANAVCGDDKLEVHTESPYGTPNDAVSFTFMVP